MTSRRTRAAGLLLCVALPGAVAACGAGPADPRGAEYAALGDSMSAGAGIAPTVGGGCLRSGRNYPALVRQEMGYSSFADVTCSGATTTNLLRPQLAGLSSREPQLDAVGPNTRLVTLTIGLNDDQLTYALLTTCLAPTGQVVSACTQVLAATPSQVDDQLTRSATRVRDSLRLIRKAAPRARIVLVGYPRYLPDTGDCPDRYPLLPAMEPRLRSALETIDQKWKAAAASIGADYVDTYALSEGHDVCSAAPWLNGTTDQPGKAVALHPFESFHEAVAHQIVGLLEKH